MQWDQTLLVQGDEHGDEVPIVFLRRYAPGGYVESDTQSTVGQATGGCDNNNPRYELLWVDR